jgi:Rps23 Pro-64 3,4-dihydroxylase Tpa1-like proline 4-hydroxylase
MKFFKQRIDTSDNIAEFSSAKPFPHIVIDNALDPLALKRLVSRYPSVDEKKWWVYENALEKKYAFNDLSQLTEEFSAFFSEVNSPNFIKQLSRLSGLDNLIPDNSLRGGGLHQIKRGGKLDVHEDFNVHHELKAFRKLNMIVYLNENWEDFWGGDLQLWNSDMTKCEKSVMPIFNRIVVFRTDMKSNHGHPDPLSCPEDMTRKSLAVYYYTPMSDEEWISHSSTSTQFKRRPEDVVDPEIEELRLRRNKGRVADKTT